MWLRFEGAFSDRAIDRLDISDEDAGRRERCKADGSFIVTNVRSWESVEVNERMKMRKSHKKLNIGAETIRRLAIVELSAAVGGGFSRRPDITCEPPTISCPTMAGCGSGGSANTCEACTLTAF
jgi:hypothetical protein